MRLKRPRLLVLSHRLPYPPHNGAAVRTFNLLQQLAIDFDVTALCFDRRDPALEKLDVQDRIAGLTPHARVEVWPIDQLHSSSRMAWDHLRSVAGRRPYVYTMHESRGFEAALRRELAQNTFDLVHIDSLDLLRFVPLVRHLPMVCNHHNAEASLLFRRADRESGARAWYIRHQAHLLARAEAHLLPLFDVNLTVSDTDADLLHEDSPTARFAVIPNGVNADFFRPKGYGNGNDNANGTRRKGCVFVGGTTWFPNRDGLEWFSSEVLPRMRASGLNDPVTWVGRVTDEEKSEFAREGLSFTGYVEDIRPHVHAAACFIAPLRVGGGTRLKILDAWAMGAPVVATRIACEGLAAIDGQNVLMADEPEDFVAATGRVLGDRGLAAHLGAGGRAVVERTYSWDIVGARLRSLYLEIIRKHSA
jgi:glycosyltransferase involved in cell wall biosynthesis